HSSAGIPSLLSSPQSQPSSGSLSRPAASSMSGPLTSSGAATSTGIPPPFRFRARRENVDWRRISAIEVDRVASELDFHTLQEHITEVTFCDVEGERCHRCKSPVDPALIKLFRLAQLTVEYLLHSQDCLSISLQAAEERLQAQAREREQLCIQLQKKTQDAKTLKEELKQRKKIIASQQAMFSTGIGANYHKCQHCEKAFMNVSFLQSHMQRRHPSEFDIKLMTDNQKKIQTMKLQEEISKLQEQLTLVTSQMETQQKDYTAKQEKELIQRQEEFKRQLEIWKEEEKMRMNSKIDEVKQACQRDMDSMHQKNRNLENELLKLQQENMQPVQTQPSTSASNEHWQEVIKLQQKLHKQEVKWAGKMIKMKEEHDSEKSLLQEELFKLQSAVSEGREESRRQVQELSHRLQEQQQIIASQNKQMKQISSKPPAITAQREGMLTLYFWTNLLFFYSLLLLFPQATVKFFSNISGVSGLSKGVYKNTLSQVITDRQKRQEEDPVYRRALKEISHKLEQRVKERNTEQPAKPKQHEQVIQSRPRSSSFPSTVTRVVSGPAPKQQHTPQPTPRSRTSTLPKTSTPLQQHRYSNIYSALNEIIRLLSSDKLLKNLHKHTDQNGNVEKITHSKVKALGKSLEKQLEARGPKKPAGGVNTLLEKPTAVKNIKQDAKKELKYTDEDDDDDDWDISSLEDVPAVTKPSQCPGPVKKSLDKSLDTSTSVWGSSTGKGQKPGLTEAGTGSTLKSSLVTVSDWDDSDEI
uniref:Cilium assembly protein DZIP1 n=1 Tax=Cyprinus carpio TaxID=7962 RepID=A0A8C1SUW9_CYPCA